VGIGAGNGDYKINFLSKYIILNKWVGKGLDRDILESIRNTVFALAAPTP
jgi:hypothetical protein